MCGHEDDPALLARLRAGDTGAADRLLQRHLAAVLAFVRLRAPTATAQLADLDAVCREVFERQASLEWPGASQFRSELCEIVLDEVRQRSGGPAGGDPLCGLWRAASAAGTTLPAAAPRSQAQRLLPDQLARLEAACALLADDDRRIIKAAKIDCLPEDAIATQLATTELAARELLLRAVVRLASVLDATAAGTGSARPTRRGGL